LDADSVGQLVNLLESSDTDPVDSAISAERNRLVSTVLHQLPESMNAVIQLIYYQGMKYREAAEVLNVPVGTVKSRLHAAIAKLVDVWSSNRLNSAE
jgi:RNA polymerase sigma-70 factor (ECF subfamily)